MSCETCGGKGYWTVEFSGEEGDITFACTDCEPSYCLRCRTEINDDEDLCKECREEEEFLAKRETGPQTLADVGMCEADFR